MKKGKSMSRREARSRAFQALYGLQFSPAADLAALQSRFEALPEETEREHNAAGTDCSGFAWELAIGVWQKMRELDAAISRFSRNWRVDRLGKVELTVLRMALYELLFCPDTPGRVAINEALELTARFGDEKSKGFVNGILDAAAKDIGRA
jgi:N utilization substance protein B